MSYKGEIVRIEPFGLGFLKPADSEQQFAFGFDQIAGYRGESLRDLNLRVGTTVSFDLHNGIVDAIKPVQPNGTDVLVHFEPFLVSG